MDFLSIVLGILTVGGMFTGGGWLLARSINVSIDKLRLEMKDDMKHFKDDMKQDMKHLEDRLISRIDAAK